MAAKLTLAAIRSLLDVVVAATTTVTAASNATPIQVTSTAHGLVTGDYAVVTEVGGNLAANGLRKVTRVDNDNVTLDGSVGSGGYTSGGKIGKVTAGLLSKIKPGDLQDLADALNRISHVRGAGESVLDSIFPTGGNNP